MAGMNWDELSAEERLLAEQAVMNYRVLNKACRDAKHGEVLSVAETLALQQGREFIRQTLQSALAEEACCVEKKRRRSGSAGAG